MLFLLTDYFAVDSYSGDVTISRPASVSSRHPATVYLNVTATDGGGLRSALILKFKVVDVNDHYPIITSPTNSIFQIPEVRKYAPAIGLQLSK